MKYSQAYKILSDVEKRLIEARDMIKNKKFNDVFDDEITALEIALCVLYDLGTQEGDTTTSPM